MLNRIRPIVEKLMGEFGKPRTFHRDENRIEAADLNLDMLERKQKELEARIRLLRIQANPRGYRRV